MAVKKLPSFLKLYFWDVDFEKLNPKKYPYYIIKRILNFGNQRAIKWLFRNFDEEDMKQSLRNHRGFTKRAAIYWSRFFEMSRKELMYFKKGFPNPPTRIWQY